jgi:hypothetical protein
VGLRWGYGDERAVGDATPPIPLEQRRTLLSASAVTKEGNSNHTGYAWELHRGTTGVTLSAREESSRVGGEGRKRK